MQYPSSCLVMLGDPKDMTLSRPSLSVWDSTAPIVSKLASVSRINSWEKSGYLKIGVFNNFYFNSVKDLSHSSVQTILLFLTFINDSNGLEYLE